VHQYDNPIDCYSEDVLREMSEKGTTWKTGMPGMAPSRFGGENSANPGAPFSPQSSAVVAALRNGQPSAKSY